MVTALHPEHWEYTLLALAREGGHVNPAAAPVQVAEGTLLDRAYSYCDAVTASHSRSFYLASRLLSHDKGRAVRALYAFCRVSDDIVDSAGSDAEAVLAAWRLIALSPAPPPCNLIATAWADARQRYQIPLRYAEQLIDGVACDLRQTRYATFAELASYAYGVASTVGLMSMHIIGFASIAAIPYAIKLGVALQLTNILRDVGEDWRVGRVYLPTDELAQYGLTEADLAAGQVDDRWCALMRFQIARNRRLYAEAWPGIALLDRDGRSAIAAAGDLYRVILADIEAHDYDVFTRRASVRPWRKLCSLWNALGWSITNVQPSPAGGTAQHPRWPRALHLRR